MRHLIYTYILLHTVYNMQVHNNSAAINYLFIIILNFFKPFILKPEQCIPEKKNEIQKKKYSIV